MISASLWKICKQSKKIPGEKRQQNEDALWCMVGKILTIQTEIVEVGTLSVKTLKAPGYSRKKFAEVLKFTSKSLQSTTLRVVIVSATTIQWLMRCAVNSRHLCVRFRPSHPSFRKARVSRVWRLLSIPSW